MAEISRTFSELWYRIAEFRPRLSAHLIVRRHTYRDEAWFVVGDPASSDFYRFNAAAYRFLGLLDGQRTVQEAWDVCNAQLGDDAPTQRDCLDLLAQLQMFGLLRNDLPIDVQRLRERFVRVREQRRLEFTGNYLFWTLPLFNPERFLARYAHLARIVFGRWGFLALAAVSLVALRLLVPRWDELRSAANNVISPDNLLWLSLCFLVLKAVHELGHAFACKAYGGRVTEMGIMFMILLPIPYCDATASWAFPNKWHRILVSAAGMMSELVVAAIAAIVWARTDVGLVHTLAYNVMFVASVATILFNLNPLLRYDGYYILADLLEIPNLSSRSTDYLKWMTRRYFFGLKGEPPPALHGRSEAATLALHGLLSFPYRLLVVLGIVLFIAQHYFVFGLVLGVFGFLAWFVAPVLKGFNHVLTEPTLQVVRVRAVLASFGLALAIVGFVGFVPMPARVHASAVVEPLERATIHAPQNGFVREIAVTNGEEVAAGRLIVRLEHPETTHQFERAKAGLELESARRDAALAEGGVEYRLAQAYYDDAQQRMATMTRIVGEMTVTAPLGGRVIAPELEPLEGAYVRQGAPLAMIATLDDMALRAFVDDSDFAWLFPNGLTTQDAAAVSVKARIYDRLGTVRDLEFDLERSGQVGTRTLPHKSLAHSVEGGTVMVDPSDPQGQRTYSPQWLVTLRPVSGEAAAALNTLPGTRARVRFSAKPQPLAEQWYRRLCQALAARFEI